jgi:hypothetical protein
VVYWYTTHGPTGITALALAVGWRCSPGSYVLFTDRRLRKRPEDDNLGEIRQGADASVAAALAGVSGSLPR